MGKRAKADITISDLKDGEITGSFTIDDLIKKTAYYDKNDIDNIINYRLDWRKSDAMFIEVIPNSNNEVEFTLPYNTVYFYMRIFWNDDNSSLLSSTPYEPEKNISFTYSDNLPKKIAIIGELGLYITKGTLIDITQFGTEVKIKSLGNLISQLDNSNKTLESVTALDQFKSSDLEVIDEYTFVGMQSANIPDSIISWDVSNVTSMKNMLRYNYNWNKNISSWSTPHLNNISGIFEGLSIIPFSINTWNFSNVMILDNVFKGLNLSNVDVSLLEFTQALTSDYMYSNTTNLTKFHLQPSNNTASITSAVGMFKGASLNSIIIDNDFDELLFAQDMFKDANIQNSTITLNCGKLIDANSIFENAIINNSTITLNFDNVEDFVSAFNNATLQGTTKININFGTKSRCNCSYMFSGTKFLNSASFDNITNTTKILYADSMFSETSFNFDMTKFNLSSCISAQSFLKNNINFNGNVQSLNFEKCLNLSYAFHGCSSFTGNGIELWNTSNLTNIDYIFYNCSLIDSRADNVLSSSLASMNYSFYNCIEFNSTKNVNLPLIQYLDYCFYNNQKMNINFNNCLFSSTLSMKSAFEKCAILTSDFTKMNPTNLINNGLDRLFADCTNFNGTLTKMVINNIVQCEEVFLNCVNFNKPVDIEITHADSIRNMFNNCPVFNSAVKILAPTCTIATSLFKGCLLFNQSITNIKLDESREIYLESMFENCKAFNQPVSTLPTKYAKTLKHLFYNCLVLNQDVGSLVVSTTTDLNGIFYNCSQIQSLNFTNLKNWNVSNCIDFTLAFYKCTYMNAELNSWNMVKANMINSMFAFCTNFNKTLSSWNVSNVFDAVTCFYKCTSLSNQNFSSWNCGLAIANNSVTNMFANIGTGNTLPSGI